MTYLFLWIIDWVIVWYIVNLPLKRINLTGGFRGYIIGSFYFLSATLISFRIFKNYLPDSSKYFLPLLITIIIGILLSRTPIFYRNIKKGRYFLIFHPFNILYQQVMVVAGFSILTSIFKLQYNDFFYGLFFFIIHSPIIFIKQSKLRYYYLFFALFGGTLFSILLRDLPNTGYIYTFLIHSFAYILVVYYLKDETKI